MIVKSKRKKIFFTIGVVVSVFSIFYGIKKSNFSVFEKIRRELASTDLFNKWSDNLFFTINQKAPVVGPILSEGEEDAYLNSVFEMVLANGALFPKLLAQVEDWKGYKAFLLAAIAVPYHESKLMHFRKLEFLGDNCSEIRHNPTFPLNAAAIQESKAAELEKKGGDENKRRAAHLKIWARSLRQLGSTFLNHFRTQQDEAPIPIADCKNLNKNMAAIQLLGSGDYLSVGMFQATLKYHVDNFIAPRRYMSVDETVNYGLSFLYDGFKPLYQVIKAAEDGQEKMTEEQIKAPNSVFKKYDCMFDVVLNSKTQKKQYSINYLNLVKGLWAGHFNSGSLAKACRFEDKKSSWRENDRNFANDFEALLSVDNSPLYEALTEKNKQIYRELLSLKSNKFSQWPVHKLPFPVSAQDLSPWDSSTLLGSANQQSQESTAEVTPASPKVAEPAPALPEVTAPVPAPIGTTEKRKGVVVNCTVVNIRANPPRGPIVAYANVDDTVTVISERRMTPESPYVWYEVEKDGKRGWVNGRFIEIK